MRQLLAALRAILAVAMLLPVAALWLLLPSLSQFRGRLPAFCWTLILSGLGIKVRLRGAPLEPARALIVANHVSWTDIPVLGLLTGAGFIAKSEIAGWPIIGFLARRLGNLFIDRGSRAAAHALAGDMNAYSAGRGLVLFAEGTTSLGSTVLPFRSSLFAVGPRWPRVQPVTIIYRGPGGEPLPLKKRRRVAWIGDDALLPHALAIATIGGLVADVWVEEPFEPKDRKQAAALSHVAITSRLAAVLAEDQAAALKRAA